MSIPVLRLECGCMPQCGCVIVFSRAGDGSFVVIDNASRMASQMSVMLNNAHMETLMVWLIDQLSV